MITVQKGILRKTDAAVHTECIEAKITEETIICCEFDEPGYIYIDN